MFSKILIANRGEIAVRIIRACKELGIKTVAVYSEADKNSLHVGLADEAVCIGSSRPQDSYLNISSIISAAEVTDSEAIHPGYGFLAENAHFAEVCESCGIKFIGPSSNCIKMMGDKVLAKKTMKKAGVPLIPGSDGPLNSKEEVLSLAKKIGYPVILKAKAGGGGRGMRICHSDVRLIGAYMTAQSEAEIAFGDGTIYLEKYLDSPRHIEIQVAMDNYGNGVYFVERDCSIQRRHQKLLEEAPSPAVNNKLRRELGEAAIRGIKSIGYTNLGTIEFLLDNKGNFYFMEMNTRIQVEHPITEEICEVDLIKLQILIAAGEKIPFRQQDINIKGHAIECRINAEDPDNNFMPSVGQIDFYYPPGGPNVRLDTHIYGGYTIPPFYDSMLAKLIAKGKDRIGAIRVMNRALDEFFIEPIKTTIPLHKKILNNNEFRKGKYNTHFLEHLIDQMNKDKE